jgi:branched-chain amino acid transport system substrate-binding protein
VNKILVGIIVSVLAIFLVVGVSFNTTGLFAQGGKVPIRIGFITDLSSSAAYWGESTMSGAKLAQKELASEGINVELLFEDYKMDPKEAVTGAQKLINFDKVDFIYSEFTPGTIAISSFIKDANILHLYVSAPVSILSQNYNIKSYTDYERNCKKLAEQFKKEGVTNMGVLSPKQEFGQLCLIGVKSVYSNVYVEEYSGLGQEKDLRTQVTKLKEKNVEAIINSGIEPDLMNMLKIVKELGWQVKVGGSSEGLSQNVINKFGDIIKGSFSVGFVELSQDFKQKINAELGRVPQTYDGAAFAYIHTKQISRAFATCDKKEFNCVKNKILNSSSEEFFGFNGFDGQIANFETKTTSFD